MDTTACRRIWSGILAFFIALAMMAPVRASAQEPVGSFDQLGTRLKVGDTVWVTDTSGAEVKGKLSELTATSLTLKGARPRTFQAPDVRAIVERPPDSLKFGALLGFGVGVGIGIAITAAVGYDDSAIFGIGLMGGLGAGVGAGIDAAIPMPKRPVYLANAGSSKRPVSWSPMVGPRSAGVRVTFAF